MKTPTSINIPQLLSAARTGFIKQGFDSPAMTELTSLFELITRLVYQTEYQWSDYNKAQWEKFVQCDNSYCGACAFSAESDGLCPESKGFGIGGPTGLYPYHLWDLTGTFGPELIRDAVKSTGKYSLDLVG